MSGRKKLVRNIIIAVIALGLLAAGYYFATVWEPATSNGKIETPETEDVISLFVPKSEQVRSVQIKNQNQSYTLAKNDDGEISIPELSNIPFIQMELRTAMSTLTSVTALDKITNDVFRAADFGLKEPSGIFTITLKDGTAKTFLVGDLLPGNDNYYFMEKDGDAIYTYSSFKAKTLFASTNEYRSTSLFSLAPSLKKVTVLKGNEVILSVRAKLENETPQNIISTGWIMDTPCPGEGAADDRINTFFENYSVVEIKEFVDDSPVNLSKYGLGNSAYTIAFDDGNNYLLKLGNRTENGVYMQYGTDPFVYLGDVSYIDAIENTEPIHYVSKFVHVVALDNIKSIKAVKDGKPFVLENNNKSGEDIAEYYKINGKSTTTSDFKKTYQLIVGILYVDQVNINVTTSPFMTITYNFKDGKSDTMKYYDYNERFYIAERSNGQRFTVLKTTLSDLFETLDK